MYAQVIEEEITTVVNEQSLREMYPSTHFPSPLTQEALEGFDGWYVVNDAVEVPEYDKASEKLEFTREFNGTSVVGKYSVVKLSNAEKAAAKEARKQEVRYHRDNTLTSTDYLMTSDVLNSFSASDQEKIVEYRQALRDLTDQEDPFNITWPVLGVESIQLRYKVEI
jgi:hypothetical protein